MWSIFTEVPSRLHHGRPPLWPIWQTKRLRFTPQPLCLSFLSMQTLREQKHITAHSITSFKFSLHFNSSKFHRPFTTRGPLILLRLQSLPSFFSFLFRKLCFTRFVLSPVLRIPLVLTPVIIRGLFTPCFRSRGTARQWRLFKWSPVPYIPRILFWLFWLLRVICI